MWFFSFNYRSIPFYRTLFGYLDSSLIDSQLPYSPYRLYKLVLGRPYHPLPYHFRSEIWPFLCISVRWSQSRGRREVRGEMKRRKRMMMRKWTRRMKRMMMYVVSKPFDLADMNLSRFLRFWVEERLKIEELQQPGPSAATAAAAAGHSLQQPDFSSMAALLMSSLPSLANQFTMNQMPTLSSSSSLQQQQPCSSSSSAADAAAAAREETATPGSSKRIILPCPRSGCEVSWSLIFEESWSMISSRCCSTRNSASLPICVFTMERCRLRWRFMSSIFWELPKCEETSWRACHIFFRNNDNLLM